MLRRLTYMVAILVIAANVGAAPASDTPNRATPSSKSATSKATAPKTANRPKVEHKKHKNIQVGEASWYGKQFQGKETASGEPYNMFDLTAAHRTLPLGTWVRVTDLKTGNSVVVRINDRGPVPETRMIDLSWEAATLLGVRARGIAEVSMEVLDAQTVAMALNAPMIN
jgi:rare lipoprotein A